jgi:hypothetical protein
VGAHRHLGLACDRDQRALRRGVGRWIAAVLLLGVAVELRVRFAPAEPRDKRWGTLGSVFIRVAW